MTEQTTPLPRNLRDAIAKDLKPVRALAAPWRRLVYAVPVLLAATLMPLVYYRLRDTEDLGLVAGWVPVAIQIFLAMALLLFALREGIPAWRASAKVVFVVLLVAYALQIVANMLIFLRLGPGGADTSVAMWMRCFRIESLIGLPILVAAAWLVARSLPQRPLLAGFLAGTGAGLAGDASWRLICPISDPAHVLFEHTGGILALGLTGFLMGYLWSLYARSSGAAGKA